MSPSAPTSRSRGSPSTMVLPLRNCSSGSYRQLRFRAFFWRSRWTSRRPLRISFPCLSSDANHSTQPAWTLVIVSAHESQRQPLNLSRRLLRCLFPIWISPLVLFDAVRLDPRSRNAWAQGRVCHAMTGPLDLCRQSFSKPVSSKPTFRGLNIILPKLATTLMP
jgi:hypothetical protein